MEDAGRKTFGSKLRAARRKAGLTQAQLARKLGVTTPYVSMLENGRVNVLSPIKLAIATEVLGDAERCLEEAADLAHGRICLPEPASPQKYALWRLLSQRWESLTDSQAEAMRMAVKQAEHEAMAAR